MAFIYQSPEGTGIGPKKWEELRHTDEWTFRQYRNGKIWVRLCWVGRYDKSLPSIYRKPFAIEVYNRVIMKESEWNETDMVDKGWVADPAASEAFRTKSAAEQAYEDMLLRYTDSVMDCDEDGNVALVEKNNELKPLAEDPTRIMDDEAQVEAAAEKGVDVGGWS